MPKQFLVANWKQSGTRKEAMAWVDTFVRERTLLTDDVKIIVCPPLKALDLVAQAIQDQNLPISVGVQDIYLHVFEGEKNTGGSSPSLLADSATYAILGHSETRINHNLTDDDVAKKVTIAKEYGITPIVCVSELTQAHALQSAHPDFNGIVAYEPLFAIGSGNPDTPENANAVAERTKHIFPQAPILYGGSVDGTNVKSFLEQEHIAGVLVGNRSLDGSFFLEIVKNAH